MPGEPPPQKKEKNDPGVHCTPQWLPALAFPPHPKPVHPHLAGSCPVQFPPPFQPPQTHFRGLLIRKSPLSPAREAGNSDAARWGVKHGGPRETGCAGGGAGLRSKQPFWLPDGVCAEPLSLSPLRIGEAEPGPVRPGFLCRPPAAPEMPPPREGGGVDYGAVRVRARRFRLTFLGGLYTRGWEVYKGGRGPELEGQASCRASISLQFWPFPKGWLQLQWGGPRGWSTAPLFTEAPRGG